MGRNKGLTRPSSLESYTVMLHLNYVFRMYGLVDDTCKNNQVFKNDIIELHQDFKALRKAAG